jgi:hypothetical protein
MALAKLPKFIDELDTKLRGASESSEGDCEVLKRLAALLPDAKSTALATIERLQQIADHAERLIGAMDFRLLLDRRRKLLSIGFDTEAQVLQNSCYDLLASEARTATLLAIAKGDIPQECWFQLSRSHTTYKGAPVLMSWTGTMFEYLMPALWMESFPNTLLHKSKHKAVEVQCDYAQRMNVPWGISESSYVDTATGTYGYYAFGVPELAVKQPDDTKLVIAPYASVMAIEFAPESVLKNMRRMVKNGWFGAYGFYEAADYSGSETRSRKRCELVRQWMAHHQGMSLLALANYLRDGVVRSWFHADRRVQATTLLLHERPMKHVSATVRRPVRRRVQSARSTQSSAH